ncbi:MAG: Maf family protein [Desulfobacteraceae bacterium]|nr:Maf family protein [Desulfobacteraceae bacterium]
MFKTLQPLILASRSPRRKRLLQSVGIEFRVEPSPVREINEGAGTPEELAAGLALLKAESVSALFPHFWVLGADTIVVFQDRILGKPVDRADAAGMLQILSGRTHEVVTGMSLINGAGGVRRSGTVVTRVAFKDLSRGEIDAYVRTAEPMDKAGAYGIQGIGGFLVRSVEGSYTNVVGLPLCETLEWLTEAKVIEPA